MSESPTCGQASGEGRHIARVGYGVIAILLVMLPRALSMVTLNKKIDEQFGDRAMWVNNIMLVAQALLSGAAIPVAGFFSQPHRCGRKMIILVLSLGHCASCASVAFFQDLRIAITLQTILSGTASPLAPNGVISVVMSWTTDWCQPADKLRLMGVIQGSLFLGLAIGNALGRLAHQYTDSPGVFMIGFYASVGAPLIIGLIFPSGVPDMENQTPRALMRRFTVMPEEALVDEDVTTSKCGLRKTCQRVGKILKFLFTRHCTVMVCLILASFAESAYTDNCQLFMLQVRDFEPVSVSTYVSAMGLSGFVFQTFSGQVLRALNISSYATLCAAIVAQLVQLLVLGYVANIEVITIMTPVFGFAFLAVVAPFAIISGETAEGNDEWDQGTLLGTAYGIKLASSSIAPLLLAFCTTEYHSFPYPLDHAGVGFGLLALLMVPGVCLSASLCIKRRRCQCDEPC